ncbi:RBPJ-interacting and tubulin-associated protein 1 isoform X2 [Ovis aries]|uniref:RBPJ-interacting and tubulin-associated protein 1 isoform X2 n=1 Tax=Ovis aries TaxID=9940 RepID=UPI001C2EA460|nr:RBPJ-interacting and tubulin-associated protein 1 isoform X2 [Ovis aries]XP_027812364.2 RBPJ-interacting and tubulin-associated protein 1 isoform X2 [Ovis aries]XP_042090597.1 RBPJ-interacting and tubulin-associated protein 1 isoform X2 [Ovis aries]
MKTPVEMAISGMQTLHVQHRGRSGYRVKVRPSYVDETLFGSPAGTRPAPPDFDPPWMKKANRPRGVGTGVSQALGANGSCESTSSSGSTPTLTPRKKNKYRLISHTPSYCEESLFGSRPEGAGWEAKWMARGVPMGSQRGAEFQRMALLGRPLGRPQGIGGALLGTDRAMVGSAPPLTTSGCSLLSPLIRTGGSTLTYLCPVLSRPHGVSVPTQGVSPRRAPTSSITPTTLSHRQV